MNYVLIIAIGIVIPWTCFVSFLGLVMLFGPFPVRRKWLKISAIGAILAAPIDMLSLILAVTIGGGDLF